ncbi:APC family permease [Ktedonosporobacter rubrisoli]|uniref:APC family permease n=1 Tax=Ktedonosporobacter rubrisoli TaxID=2509675 RepID=A0A4P6JPY1_KTERU|nr:APC family permease [Ktedonosporobacter rubrisoli]QBD77457.1 APC family permease [Ktedonosporobacter rubrisoli]
MSEVLEGAPVGESAEQDTTLKKNAIGLSEVLFQSITAMAPAAAVCFAMTSAYGLSGASTPLAVFLATIACAFIASCIGQLAIHIPSAGGMYTYISRSLGAKFGFLSAWVFLLAQPLLLPYVALIWGQYAEDLVKLLTGVDISWVIWTIIGCIILFALTFYGIKLSADASVILGAIEILVLLTLALTMIFASGGHNNLATFTPAFSPTGWSGIFQGMIFAFLAFVGFEAAAPLGEETSHPRRNIPLAVIFSAIGIGLFYVLASYASVIGWGIPAISGYANDATPWADLGKKFWGMLGPIIISFVIINSSIGNGNAGINATSRVAYAMGRVGALPASFARLSSHRTPSFAILLHTVVSAIITIGCGLLFGISGASNLIGTALTLGLLLLYFASCISTFVYYLRKRREDFRIVQHVIVPLVPLVILCFVFASQVYPIPAYPQNLSLPILAVWILLGIGYMFYLMRTNKEALARGSEIFLEEEGSEPAELAEAPA